MNLATKYFGRPALVALALGIVTAIANTALAADPEPSPLYQQSLKSTVERLDPDDSPPPVDRVPRASGLEPEPDPLPVPASAEMTTSPALPTTSTSCMPTTCTTCSITCGTTCFGSATCLGCYTCSGETTCPGSYTCPGEPTCDATCAG